jgi:DNA (cytosine-5)-methyltransferase 1
MTHLLRVGDLFSGIGGMSLGLRMTGGFETRWFCEVDPYCQKVLAKHWPGVPCYGDIRELEGADVETVDVLVGGFPCQPVSIIGQRKGTSDDRWLWGEYIRLIRQIRPRWVVVENVTGLRAIDDGRVFGTVLRDLAESGYDAEWDCIPASAVGAPHPRDRVWLVAYPARVSSDARADGHDSEPWSIFVAARRSGGFQHHPHWISEPSVGGVVDGIPTPMDRNRLTALGNAEVPQIVAEIGRQISNCEQEIANQ